MNLYTCIVKIMKPIYVYIKLFKYIHVYGILYLRDNYIFQVWIWIRVTYRFPEHFDLNTSQLLSFLTMRRVFYGRNCDSAAVLVLIGTLPRRLEHNSRYNLVCHVHVDFHSSSWRLLWNVWQDLSKQCHQRNYRTILRIVAFFNSKCSHSYAIDELSRI